MAGESTRLAYGIQAVRQALSRGVARQLYVQQDVGARRLGRLAVDIERSGLDIRRCTAEELRRMTGVEKHQGVAADVVATGAITEREAQDVLRRLEQPLLLVLDGVQDPRNFGAVLRTADAAGVDLVVTARSRNVGMTPVVSKVACGAAESQLVAEVGNLARFLQFACDAGLRIVGTDDQAPQTLYQVDLTGPLALVMGGEGEGMRRLTRERCDTLVSIPMAGAVESLNVAVAAGVCLYEAVRQRLASAALLR